MPNNKNKGLNSQWTKLKNNIFKILLNCTQITVLKGSCKDSNVENVENKHLKDVQNVNQYGTVQRSAKLNTGLSTRLNVTQEQNK